MAIIPVKPNIKEIFATHAIILAQRTILGANLLYGDCCPILKSHLLTPYLPGFVHRSYISCPSPTALPRSIDNLCNRLSRQGSNRGLSPLVRYSSYFFLPFDLNSRDARTIHYSIICRFYRFFFTLKYTTGAPFAFRWPFMDINPSVFFDFHDNHHLNFVIF